MGACEACGARVRWGWDDDAADLGQCRECYEELCSKCAGYWDVDGGYGDDGSQVRIAARCKACEGE